MKNVNGKQYASLWRALVIGVFVAMDSPSWVDWTSDMRKLILYYY